MKVLILAAGFGTRVQHLTGGKPKALMPYKDGVLLDALIEQFTASDEISLITNALYRSQFEQWADGKDRKILLIDNQVMSESERKGALFDLALALDHVGIDEPMIVVGSDTIFDFSLAAFGEALARDHCSLVGVRKNPDLEDQKRRGVVQMDALGRITGFKEKPLSPKSDTAATALYGFMPEALRRLKPYLADNQNIDAPGYFIQYLIDQVPMGAWWLPGPIIDFGHADALSKSLMS
jgi:NDP-sugar pyrophosphorylase family protein